jgi:hypothetical protein
MDDIRLYNSQSIGTPSSLPKSNKMQSKSLPIRIHVQRNSCFDNPPLLCRPASHSVEYVNTLYRELALVPITASCVWSHQESANEPQYARHESKAFNGSPLITIIVVCVSIPVPYAKDSRADKTILTDPGVPGCKCRKPAKWHKEVNRIVHKSPRERHEPY